jgi:hypothetical protein
VLSGGVAAITDGAIMTPTDTIGTPSAVVIHSGHDTDVLTPLGGSRTYLGTEPGRAAAFDVALLDLFWTSVAGVAHAFALARSENITATELAPLARGIGNLLPIVIDEHSRRLAEDNHPGDEANLLSATAGMAHIIETSEARGIDASVMKPRTHWPARPSTPATAGDGLSRLTVQLEQARG